MGMDTLTGLKPRVHESARKYWELKYVAMALRTEVPTQRASHSQGTSLTAGTLEQWLAKNGARPYLNKLQGCSIRRILRG